jgi:hypothetical protein
MKTRDFNSLEQQLLPVLPNFTIKGPMMFVRPIGRVLRGLYFESSSFDAEAVYVWAFFLPLCVPAKNVSFNLGKRLRGEQGERWSVNAPNMTAELGIAIKRDALSFLSRVESLNHVAQAASLLTPQDLYIQQAIVYASAAGGNVQETKELLDQFLLRLDIAIPWQREMAERAEWLRKIVASNPADAQRQLETWEAETAKSLGLETYR